MCNRSHLTEQVAALLGRFILAAPLALALLLTGVATARADIGPKETMEFTFVQGADSTLAIVEATLLECADPACVQAHPLEHLGPQYFTCTKDRCTSLAYGYSPYHQLVIRFSDGIERRSNVFSKRGFDAVYRVTIAESTLEVEELRGRATPRIGLLGGILGAIGSGGLIVVALALIIVLALRANRAPLAYREVPMAYLATWLLTLVVGLAGAFYAPALPLTLLIEGTLAAGYAVLRHRSVSTLVTLVLLSSLLTQPLLGLALLAIGATPLYLLIVGVLEIAVWLIEAAALHLMQRRTSTLSETLALSFVLNLVSFSVGLLLTL